MESRARWQPRTLARCLVPVGVLSMASIARCADDWEPVLQQALGAEHSQTRQDGLKQIDTNTVKGLKALWKVLAIRDPNKVDWYVRKGAHDALLRATSEEAEKEIDRVMKGAEDELAREAIIYSVIEKIRLEAVKMYGENNDRKIADIKLKLRKTRGVDYFDMVLPVVKAFDPDKKLLKRIQTPLLDKGPTAGTGEKSPRVRRAAITAMTAYPDTSSIPLLIENLKKLEKVKAKNYREWVLSRGALETLTGQYFRDSVGDWERWWNVMKDKFTVEKRVEEEKGKDEEGKGKTVVVSKDGVEVTLNMKVAGEANGYPLVVFPIEQHEVDYFRPYFHGIEELCRVYYIRLPLIEDFKGLAREEKSNLVVYPTETLAKAVGELMKNQNIDKFGVLAHGPTSGTLAMMFTAANPTKVTHMILINPRSAGNAYSTCMDNVRREGMKRGNKEIVKGIDMLTLMEDGNPKYKPSDDAEKSGCGRAIDELRFADPTEPEAGSLDDLYEIPGGTQQMNDNKWSAKAIFKDKKTDLPVLILMGTRSPWTPISDMKVVAGIFKRAVTVELPESGEYPFLSETYAFTKHVETFLKPAIQARKSRDEKDKARQAKDDEKADKKGKEKEKDKGKSEKTKS